MNESWGYKSMDLHYKSSKEILRTLCRMAGKSTNYLLNVGPDGSGNFPVQSKEILRDCGAFLAKYGEGLYGTQALKRIQCFEFRWGDVVWKGNTLYFWIFDPSQEVHFYGLRNKVKKVTHLGEDIPFSTDHDEKMDYHRLSMDLPAAGLPEICVVAVEFEGDLSYNEASYGSADF